MRAALLLALRLCAGGADARSAGEDGWPTRIMGHFYVHHQNPAPRKDLLGGVEAAYSALLKEFWSLGGAMQTRKAELYLYASRDDYRAGRFEPSAWSDGMALTPAKRDGPRVFVTHEQADMSLVRHELCHLFLGAVFGEARRGAAPPRWLDEGLAVVIGTGAPSVTRPQGMAAFLKSAPDPSAPANDPSVSAWYRQAGSVVGFLRRAPGGRFPKLVASLRDGESTERALRMVYGYLDLAAFERAWLKTVETPGRTALIPL